MTPSNDNDESWAQITMLLCEFRIARMLKKLTKMMEG